MGRALRDSFPDIERKLLDINKELGRDIASALDAGPDLLFPPQDTPHPTVFMEVTTALSLAVARSLADEGVRPGAAAGRSMGEYAAACFSGVFGTRACFGMVRRVTLEGKKVCVSSPSVLASVYGLTRRELSAAAKKLSAAGELCETVIFYDKAKLGVLGLRQSGLPALKAALSPFRHKLVLSKEHGAFHSTLFSGVARRAEAHFRKLSFAAPRTALYMNFDGAAEAGPGGVRRKLAGALCAPVLWQETIAAMLKDGVRTFVELAPGAMLTEFICRLPADAEVLRTDTPENYAAALRRLTGGSRA